ncbi:hypothetical protein TrVFT333_009226 [Trichoderma virens FT-333]|nr:hypothetical protein TrVFT333_009226 [Trichoderma virens FT-333]
MVNFNVTQNSAKRAGYEVDHRDNIELSVLFVTPSIDVFHCECDASVGIAHLECQDMIVFFDDLSVYSDMDGETIRHIL